MFNFKRKAVCTLIFVLSAMAWISCGVQEKSRLNPSANEERVNPTPTNPDATLSFTYGKNNTLKVSPGAEISSPFLPEITGGIPTGYSINASDQETITKYGLKFDSTTGGITGVPQFPSGSTEGQFKIMVSAVNPANTRTVFAVVSINILPAFTYEKNNLIILPPLGTQISSPLLPNKIKEDIYTNYSINSADMDILTSNGLTFDTALGTGGIAGTPKQPPNSSRSQINIIVSAISSETGSTVFVKVTLVSGSVFTYGSNNFLEFHSGAQITTPQLPTVVGDAVFTSYSISTPDQQTLTKFGFAKFNSVTGGITGIPKIPAGIIDGQFTIIVSSIDSINGEVVNCKVTINIIPKKGFVITANNNLDYYANGVFVKTVNTFDQKTPLTSISYTGDAVYITKGGDTSELDKCDSDGYNCNKIEIGDKYIKILYGASFIAGGKGFALKNTDILPGFLSQVFLYPFKDNQPQSSKEINLLAIPTSVISFIDSISISYTPMALYALIPNLNRIIPIAYILKQCSIDGEKCQTMDFYSDNKDDSAPIGLSFHSDGSGYVIRAGGVSRGELYYYSKDKAVIGKSVYTFDQNMPPTAISYAADAVYITTGGTDPKGYKLIRCSIGTSPNCTEIDTYNSAPRGVSFE